MVNVEACRQGVSINTYVTYFHINHLPLLFSCELIVYMRIINIFFLHEVSIMVPCYLIRIISSETLYLDPPTVASSATTSTATSYTSAAPTPAWINYWNTWARSVVWTRIEFIVLINIFSKHVAVGIKCMIGTWESVLLSIQGDAIVNQIIFLKYSLNLITFCYSVKMWALSAWMRCWICAELYYNKSQY